ncbi:hypothetical protein [Flavobacterium limnophilum]|uniref:hypothetical protein n=1 Tax=Flavobacterium limnophilum TaxID=3003262 RepID=UPI002482EC94|nr:hypothetical protein [Flavobacterium limnophilum]
MKTVKQIMLVVLGLLFFSLQGCSHDDYIPVPGPAGENGTDGVSGTASCESCHSVEHKQPIIDAYDLSKHKSGSSHGTTVTLFDDGSLNSNSGMFCTQCHTQEGYIDNLKYGKPNTGGYSLTKSISCEGCHGTTHRSLNFTKDGNDFGLRNIIAVVQKTNPAFTLNASPTGGKSSSNTCISCHQASSDRDGINKKPVIESAEMDLAGVAVISGGTVPGYKIWSQRNLALAVSPYPKGTTNYKTYTNNTIGSTGRSLHGTTTADIWMGTTGIDIEGTTTHLPAAKTAKHYTSASCVQCHMDTPKTGTVNNGSHTMVNSFASCIKCHTDATSLYAGLKTTYDTEFTKLVAAFGSGGAAQYFTTSATVNANTGFKTISINTGFIADPNKTSKDNIPYDQSKVVPLKYIQAFWNYKLLVRDNLRGSKGIHNPLYTKALIQNSIEALK